MDPQVTIDISTRATSLPGFGVSFASWISSLLSVVMLVAALFLLYYLIWGGIEWINAAGDSGKIQKARDKMTQAVIGIIVLASTLALFQLIQSFLGINVLNFGSGNTSGSGLRFNEADRPGPNNQGSKDNIFIPNGPI